MTGDESISDFVGCGTGKGLLPGEVVHCTLDCNSANNQTKKSHCSSGAAQLAKTTNDVADSADDAIERTCKNIKDPRDEGKVRYNDLFKTIESILNSSEDVYECITECCKLFFILNCKTAQRVETGAKV